MSGPASEAPQVWTEAFRVRAYEVGPDQYASPLTLCDYFQEAAGDHARALGLERFALPSGEGTWVLQRLRLEVDRLPAWRETVTVETWPSAEDGLRADRDFVLAAESGEAFARGTSRWYVVDLARRRPVRLPPEVLALRIPTRPFAVAHGAPEPAPPEALTSERRFEVRRADVDWNGHANNARFVEWALEAVPADFEAAHRLAALDVGFRGEAFAGDTVVSVAAPAGPAAWAHKLTRAGDGRLLAVLRTDWTPH